MEIDKPSELMTQGQVIAYHYKKLGEEINRLQVEEQRFKTTGSGLLKDELDSDKVNWNAGRGPQAEDEKSEFRSWEVEKHSLETRIMALETQIMTLKGSERRVVCLIDGDGTIFPPNLVAQGEQGGTAAAGELRELIEEYLLSKHYLNPDQYRLWTYIFLNKGGLAYAFKKSGEKYPGFSNFIAGFNNASQRFLMLDVGSGKEKVDTRINEYLDDNIRMPQTAKIFFGCCHDNGYATTLQSLITDGFREKIVLLRGFTEMAAEVEKLGLPCVPSSSLFIPEKIPTPKPTPKLGTSPLPPQQFRPRTGSAPPLQSGLGPRSPLASPVIVPETQPEEGLIYTPL